MNHFNFPKAIFISIFSLALSQISLAQNQSFEWAKRMGGTDWEIGISIANDNNGNIYTTGRFTGTVDFDPGAGIINLTSKGQDDIFIHKLDTAGNLLWVKQMGGTNTDIGYSITTDNNDNVYTTGVFADTVDFNPGAGTTNFSSISGTFDIFIQKLDASGDFLWAKQIGGTNVQTVRSITIDKSGNVYTTGCFRGTVDFDPGIDTANLTGDWDIFIQKLDASGNFLWVKQMGGTGGD